MRINLTYVSVQKVDMCSPRLSGADSTPPPVALQVLAALRSAISNVSQGCRSSTPPPSQGPCRTPTQTPCSIYLGSWEGLPPASLRGVAGSLDPRNPVPLQGVEQLHLRVSRYTLKLSSSNGTKLKGARICAGLFLFGAHRRGRGGANLYIL